jgi:hypothetical protein
MFSISKLIWQKNTEKGILSWSAICFGSRVHAFFCDTALRERRLVVFRFSKNKTT